MLGHNYVYVYNVVPDLRSFLTDTMASNNSPGFVHTILFTFVTELLMSIAGNFSSLFFTILLRFKIPVVVCSEIPFIPSTEKKKSQINNMYHDAYQLYL